MEGPYPWRVLEDVAETAPPSPPSPPGIGAVPAARGPWASPRLLAVATAAVAGVVIAVVVVGGVGGAARAPLLLPGDGAPGMAAGQLLSSGAPATSSPGASAPLLVVDVAGAVRRPGVYRLAEGSRVVDAIAAAGGYGPRVDADAASRLNLAAPVHDGEQVRVASRDDLPAGGGTPTAGLGRAPAPTSSGGSGGLVNVNTASADELDTLPGIGPATAAKIIAAREEKPFAAVKELRSRGVVGEATFRKLESLVTVGT